MQGDVPRSIDTVVIGGGHAGLMLSWHLQRAGREHIVLERRATLGGGWQDRWDGFQLVSPNWMSTLPGLPYDGDEPDDFMPRDAMIARVAGYAAAIGAPVHTSTEVTRLSPRGRGDRRFHLETSQGPIETDTVIAATGAFQRPRIPPAASAIDAAITQVHAHDYRSPDALTPGGVLVIGSGQTGCQLAEELHAAGRPVVLATGRCGRAPRRYRGHDVFWWMRQLAEHEPAPGARLMRVDELPTPRARFACNPHVSGHGGGHDTNLRRFALDGIRLTGRFRDADGHRVRFEPDLGANLEFADRFFDDQLGKRVEAYIAATGMEVSADDRAWPEADPPETEELDLTAEGITTILWTTGYAPDYDWLDLPILDEFGTPRHVRGVSEVPGLSFLGMLWQLDNASANLIGVHRDAAYLASTW